MDPEPAAAFIKFRVNPSSNLPAPRRRTRAVLSCRPCHQAKVKCDRGQPCSRCSGVPSRVNKCIYDSNDVSPPASTSPIIGSEIVTSAEPAIAPVTKEYFATSKHIRKGLTHFSNILSEEQVNPEFEDTKLYVLDQVPEFREWYSRLRDLKPRPSNSFGDNIISCRRPTQGECSVQAILSNLPSVTQMKLLVDNYICTFETLYPLLNIEEVYTDCQGLGQPDQEIKLTRLAQLLIVFVLSSRSTPEIIIEHSIPAQDWYTWAEACLVESQYASYPDLPALRSLCMMAMLKMISRETPSTSDGLWALIGFIVRMAMSMQLHEYSSEYDLDTNRSRCQVWWTIVYLDIICAIESGFPPVLRADDWDIASLTPSVGDGTSFVTRVKTVYPTVTDAITMMNSARTRHIGYDKILKFDAELRGYLRLDMTPSTHRTDDVNARLAGTMVEVMVRQTLLSLHQPYALRRGETSDFETSHWAVLECSLAILRIQQSLWADTKRCGSDRAWLFITSQPQYTLAMFHTISGLRRGAYANDHLMRNHSKSPENCPAEMAWITLTASYEILSKLAPRSNQIYKMFFGVTLSMAALKAQQTGTPVHDNMVAAAEMIQRTMEAAKR